MTALEMYQKICRVERVKVTNNRVGDISEGTVSKVYRIRAEYYPSGCHYVFLVWSKDLNKCVWVRDDDVTVIKYSDVKLHQVR